MAKQTINVGATGNDPVADTIRDSFIKTNENFTEVYEAMNNTTKYIPNFWPGEAPPTEAAVVAYINEYMTFNVTEINSRVYIRFFVIINGAYWQYVFDFGGGKGAWGANPDDEDDIVPVSASRIKLISSFPVTPSDISEDDQTEIVALGDIYYADNFIANANGEARDFSDPDKSYYFSYYAGDILYLALFIGEPGLYGAGTGQSFEEGDFAQVTNSEVTPIPTLQQVNADGQGTTTPLTVKDPSGVPKLSHRKDMLTFTNSVGDVTEYHADPASSEPEKVIARIGEVIPITGTQEGNPVTGDIEVDNGVGFKNTNVFEGKVSRIYIVDGNAFLETYDSNIGSFTRISTVGNAIEIQSTATGSRGITGSEDYSLNITNLDFTQKIYVDNAVAGLFWKTECLVATTANITLSGLQTIDGVALAGGERVLVKNQTTAADNGIYIAASGSWARATDADTGAELANKTIPVTKGTANQDTWWTITNDSITLGTTAIAFTQTGGMGTYANGSGLLLTGNLFSVDPSYVSTGVAAAIAAKIQNSMAASTTVAPSVTAVKTEIDKHGNIKNDVTSDSSVTGSTSETILGVCTIAANTVGTGSLILRAVFNKTGSAGSATVKVYTNTVNSLSGSPVLLGTYNAAANNRYIPFRREFELKASNVIFGFPSGATSLDGMNAAASSPLSATFNPTVDNYIIFTFQAADASDSTVLSSLRVKYEKSV